jgi:hypothetical protein
MKKVLLSFGLLIAGLSFAQTDILDARTNYSVGQTVTVSGVVTNGGELGAIRYLQDGTAGIAAYGSPATDADLGDTVTTTGTLVDYNGLLELSPTSSMTVHGVAVVPAVPQVISITDASDTYEGQLVRFENMTIQTVETTFAGNTNYDFTDGVNTLEVRISNGSNLVGESIPTGPVTITGILGQYNTYQVLARTTADIVPYVAPDKEINVTINGISKLSGSEYLVGTTISTTVTIENLGAGAALNISGVSFTGVAMGDYSVLGVPATVAAGASEDFTLIFTASTTGSRIATMEIANDDTDEGTYLIDLYGVGTDGFATEPAAAPTNLTFPVIEAYTLTGTYDVEPSAENYLVLWNIGSAPSMDPTDGETYLRGDVIGNSKVAFNGPSSAFTPRHVIANQDYYFSVYAYNGPEGFENYTANSAVGNTTSGGENIGAYYSGLDQEATSFVSDLTAIVNPHDFSSYGNYKSFVMNAFEIRDTTDGRSFVICALSGERKVFDGAFDWTATGYSREHTFAHSWMPSWPADDPYPGLDEYNDYHNLYPANLNQANTPRSNLPLGNVTGTVNFNYLGGTVGQNDEGAMVYEPRAEHRGNAARSMMYMAIAYNMVDGDNWALPSNQDQDVMKEWHFSDLPDNYEIARQEKIASIQNNRNPFVDSVDYVCHIDFSNMTYLSDTDGCESGTQAIQELDLNRLVSVFPVPTSSELYIAVNELVPGLSVQIKDMHGRVVNNMSKAQLYYQVNTADWAAGVYFVEVKSDNSSITRKIVKQ